MPDTFSRPIHDKNHVKSCCKSVLSENNFFVYLNDPSSKIKFEVGGSVKKELVQFYFSLEGNYIFKFGPHYSLELKKDHYFFFYNPEKDLEFTIEGPSEGMWVSVFMTVDKLHSLFLEDVFSLSFLQGDNARQKIYEEKEMSTLERMALQQLFSTELSDSTFKVFVKAKIYEVMALHFTEKDTDMEACPFLKDEEDLGKIHKAKKILLDRMMEPPGLTELAKEVGLSEYKLKSGFKEVYGNTAYGYLLDYRLNHAKHLLDMGKLQVNEIAYDIGYTNPSHFIAAFKKKYGVTPKKYLQSR